MELPKGGQNVFYRRLFASREPEPVDHYGCSLGASWKPSDYPKDIAVSWDDQVQKAVDCYNAGASLLHIHVRDPKTGKILPINEIELLCVALESACTNLNPDGAPLIPRSEAMVAWAGLPPKHE
jgi:hypothetical protein